MTNVYRKTGNTFSFESGDIMSGKPKHPPMTDEEIDEMNNLVIMDNQLYRKTEDAGAQIAAIVNAVTGDLTSSPERVDLGNLDNVILITRKYVASCLKNGILPSKSGHARALGISRQGINKFLAKNSENNKVAEYLRILYDSFAEAMEMASLTGKIHPIVSIFILKCIYHFSENEKDAEIPYNPLGECTSAEEIAEKYKYILETIEQDDEFEREEHMAVADAKEYTNEEQS